MRADLIDAALRSVAAWRVAEGRRARFDDRVALETPVALVYNGEPHAVMMATPADLADFALGFSLTEGIVAARDELELVDCVASERGVSLQMLIPHAAFTALRDRRRAFDGRSGCGLCGVESLEAAVRPVARVPDAAPVAAAAISAGIARLASLQPFNRESGGLHAASLVDGDVLVVREDVGRHNALDKLVGALAVEPRAPGFLAMTSRASYEIVHKAAAAGIAIVAAVSAPTELAIRTAEAAGITLVAFVRGDAMTIYANPQRILDARSLRPPPGSL
ncbi:MAG TPA: formate dehydrogenase accessory sulfurtransferase FdhD [Candidatus Saccharimonadia bacterium]|nr:formate dehydrogenase accessory sulfurtransferase FdhD [Candidatus Saccharimonadia bacterium]